MSSTRRGATLRQIPAGDWVLGFVSMLIDISSEMIHSLLPLFMVITLGANALAVGLIEGLAESTALIVKVFSGKLSDYLGKRKELAVFGYALGALTKPLFALAPSASGLATPWWPTSRHRTYWVRPFACASRVTPSEHSLGRSWPSD